MKTKRFIFGPFPTNCYAVSDEKGGVLLVDPACSDAYEQQQLLAYISSLEAERVHILATHGHLDHLWGAAWACAQWQTPVLMHMADIPLAQAMQAQYDLFGISGTPAPFPIAELQEGMPGLEAGLRILHTPGHTQGSVCLYWEQEHVLLSGDTLFSMGYGRTDLPGGNTGQLIDSLERLFTLPPETRVYPGHGEETTIGAERRS